MSRFHFPDAIVAIESWLEGLGKATAVQLPRSAASKTAEWRLDLREMGYPVADVRLRLSHLFPAAPCELFVSPDLCLKLPHVEETGRVCLDEICQPADFGNPVGAVLRAVEQFKTDFLEHTANEGWRQKELHSERLSYWGRFCALRQKSPQGRPRPRATLVSMGPVELWAEGRIAAYVPKGSRERRIDTQIVALGEVDPVELARRHGLDNGTVIKGNALFVRIPDDIEWTPLTWPKNFGELEMLVRLATSDQKSAITWLADHGWTDESEGAAILLEKAKLPDGYKPLLVVLCHGNELYGYQISPPCVSLVAGPHAAPVSIARIDPRWALTRDHESTVFGKRQRKRVLILGAGSLGSPIVDVLARSGVGEIDIVDSQLMEAPNVSRHVLGLSSLRHGKATAIAARLNKEIPGLTANGYVAEAREWMTEHCTPGRYDLVLDLTAEASVRIFLSHTRTALFGQSDIVHAWVEPFCAAAHVVASNLDVPWPATDPVRASVNAADFSAAAVRVNLPACSDGFHPYGSADILQAAGFSAERIINVLDEGLPSSMVWSFVRTQAFFGALNVQVSTNAIVPVHGGPRDGVMITRALEALLRND